MAKEGIVLNSVNILILVGGEFAQQSEETPAQLRLLRIAWIGIEVNLAEADVMPQMLWLIL